jgi:hypothetical protein
MEAGLYNFQLPKSGDVATVMTGIAFVAAVTHGEPGEEAAAEGEGVPEATPYNFFNVRRTTGNFSLVNEAPNRMPDLESKSAFSQAGDKLISRYWNAPELGGMFRQSNHWGGLGVNDWSLVGPKGWVATPGYWQMFPEDKMPVGFIKYSDLDPWIGHNFQLHP